LDAISSAQRLVKALMVGALALIASGSAINAETRSVDAEKCLAPWPEPVDMATLVTSCSTALDAATVAAGDRPRLLASRGKALLELGDLQAALKDLQEADTLLPSNAEILRSSGRAMVGLGMATEAEILLTQSLAIERHWQALQARCAARFQLRKPIDATADCDETVAKHRTAETMANLAYLRVDTDLAKKALSREDVTPRAYAMGVATYISLSHQRNMKDSFETRRAILREAGILMDDGLRRFPSDPLLLQVQQSLKEEIAALPN